MFDTCSVQEQTDAINRIKAGESVEAESFNRNSPCGPILKNLGMDQILFIRDGHVLDFQSTPLAQSRNRYCGDCEEFIKIHESPEAVTLVWNHCHEKEIIADLALHKQGGSPSVSSHLMRGYEENLRPTLIQNNIMMVRKLIFLPLFFQLGSQKTIIT